jgi:hypothetical protein
VAVGAVRRHDAALLLVEELVGAVGVDLLDGRVVDQGL